VKAANPGFSICEIGATIGRMWRELADEEKQRHMEDFNKDKVVNMRWFVCSGTCVVTVNTGTFWRPSVIPLHKSLKQPCHVVTLTKQSCVKFHNS